jgi:hypothetical protein
VLCLVRLATGKKFEGVAWGQVFSQGRQIRRGGFPLEEVKSCSNRLRSKVSVGDRPKKVLRGAAELGTYRSKEKK